MSRKIAGLVLGLLIVAVETASADQDSAEGYFRNWFARVDKTQEEQPHWMTPVVTVTPRLEEEVRYDQFWQHKPKSAFLTNYGGPKGLELIPTENTEIILGIPAYQVLRTPKTKEVGWTDEPVLLKYRFWAANEEHGNYILTGFLGVSFPTGSEEFTTKQVIYTPTIAAGKGWGTREAGFDIQSTVSGSIPDGHETKIGVPIVWNTALQAYAFKRLWPELEFNYTHFIDGPNSGKDQLLLTPGVIFGRFPIEGRVKLVVGFGYQIPVTSFQAIDHGWILTVRTPF